ncbi:NAD(P)-dependent alcohol dehydrogenase [Planococcus liqunii]|uniref:NAD(P)-dependent alcohol dehydrogenase n=1 Tax=Planococcus liqunii TaxID=3058394 RepID=UPI002627F1E9|nr:NAD(P)-dependent alcohol dehydrogenase [Planococcus sp. N056]WKA52433.1 NAD(P)-dependent alcohol dehydrogenase [Planococcus sp. N056]
MKIQAAVTHGLGEEFKFEEVELGEPKDHEVLVKIVASGVCHTDAVARDLGLSPFPAVLGHEGSGVVEKVGSAVTSIEAGDHVVLSFAYCGHCENCLTGHPTVCLNFNELNFGGKMQDGTNRIHHHDHAVSTFFGQSSFGTFAVTNERNVVKVDKEVDLTLLGPLGCGIQTGAGTVLNRIKPEFGSSIAVFGSGAVGLSAVMAAKIAGCLNIIAVDIHDNRLELAKELGATHTLNGKIVDVVNEIKEITGGGTHYAVETTGVPPVVKQAIHSLRPLGSCAIVGVTPEITFDVHNDIMAEGKTVMGVIEGDSIPQVFIPQLVAYYKRGMFPFDKLTKVYEFEQLNEAFEDSKNGSTIKPIVKIGQ